MSVIGGYMPCLDQSIDVYRENLLTLGKAITELDPVVIVGDFNAHPEKLGGPKGLGDPNVQGVLLNDLLDRCELNAVSSGAAHMYRCGSTIMTVDCADSISETYTTDLARRLYSRYHHIYRAAERAEGARGKAFTREARANLLINYS